jgi:hypothetical protein
MRTSILGAKIVGIATAAGILAACSSGSQSSLNPSAGSAVPNASRVALVPKSGALYDVPARRQSGPAHSWMLPDHHRRKALLYVSDYNNNQLDVYTYPKLKPVGTVTGLSAPDGICNDKNGNIWVDNNQGQSIVEFAHRGTSPKATLSDPGTYPVGCSVDPMTGNLAVSNIFTTSGGQGSVAVYAGAKGTPTLYKDANVYDVYFCGYDNQGNLFVDGRDISGTFHFAELKKGGSSLTDIPLTGGTIYFPGNIRWDGAHVAVGDQEYGNSATSAIYQTTGAGGTIVGTTPLTGSIDVVGFSIQKSTAIGPDAAQAEVGFWNYPAGGSPTKTITGFSAPYGTAISR